MDKWFPCNKHKTLLLSMAVLLLSLLMCTFSIILAAIPLDFKDETIAGGNLYNYSFKSGLLSLINPDVIYIATTSKIMQFNQKTGESIMLMGCTSEKCDGAEKLSSKTIKATAFYYPISSFHVWEDFLSGNKTIYVSGFKEIIAIDNDGYVRLFAGAVSGTFHRGDGGLAVNARFLVINSIWVDQKGIVYVSDDMDNRIRKIDLNGTISTFAGMDGIESNLKSNGLSNETVLSNPKKIIGMNNYLYGIDLFSTFKIDLNTMWLTVISGSEYNINNNYQENGLAINSSILADSMDITSDGTIILAYSRQLLKIKNGIISKFADLSKYFSSSNGFYLFSGNYVMNIDLVGRVDLNSGELTRLFNSEFGPLLNRIDGRLMRFKSISAMAFNETSRLMYIADDSIKNLQISVMNIDTYQVEKYSLSNRISNESCRYPGVSTVGISESETPTGLVLHNDSILVMSNLGLQFNLQKFNLNSDSNCMYAGSITHDRLLINTNTSNIILSNPKGLYCAAGLTPIYIADTNNHRVLVYYPNTDQVQLIAGTGIPGFSGDGSLAVHAQLFGPESVYYEKQDESVLIADTGNNRIRRITKDGIIKTLAGNGNAEFNGDFQNPLQASLNSPNFVMGTRFGVMISDTRNHRVRLIPISNSSNIFTLAGTGTTGTKIAENTAKETELNAPSGLLVVRNSMDSFSLYITDTSNHRVLLVKYRNVELSKLSSLEGVVSVFAGNTLTGYNGDGILAINAKLFFPSSIVPSLTGFLISDSYNSRIRFVSSTGYIYSKISNDGNIRIGFPFGLCSKQTSDDSFYFTEYNNVRLFSTVMSTLVGGIGDGLDVYYSDINPTKMVTINDEIIISESTANRIRSVDRNGIIRTIAGTGQSGDGGDGGIAKLATLRTPTGMAIHPTTNEIYLCDSDNHRIRKLTRKSDYYVISTVAGSGEGGFDLKSDPLLTKFSNPKVIAFMRNGDLVIGDLTNYMIRIISNGRIRTAFKYPISIISDIQVTSDNSILISLSETIVRLTPYCKEGYQIDSNRTECLAVCFGIPENETSSVCFGNGACISSNSCQCNERYTGIQCEIPICYGIPANDSSVCSKNGTCSLPNSCKCNEGYYGAQCENAICHSKLIGESCGGVDRGFCTSKDYCSCKANFIGEECQLSSCSGFSEKDPNVCMGRGICKTTGDCTCDFGYSGNNCQDSGQMIAFIVSFVAVLLLCVALVVAIVFFSSILAKKHRAQKKIIRVDLSLDERLITSFHLEPNHTELEENDFFIPLNKLGMEKPVKRLGEGGIGSVYQTIWSGMTVAVKVFDLNNINISEEDFRVEAILLSKLRHPNIVNFFGVSTSPTKRYIVMECMEQSLDKVILKLESKTMALPLVEKIKMLISIANGVEYLHNLKPRKIIHRDLKPQNILLDANENCKVCDFGLSRLLSQGTKNSITNNIGSVFYMSPEMNDVQSIAPENATAVDIYSFSIIMWQLLFEVKDPYMSGIPSVLEKLGLTTKPEYMSPYKLSRMVCEKRLRPIIPFNSLDSCEEWCENFMEDESADFAIVFELTKLIQRCWEHDPKERPSIEEISQQLSSLEQELLGYGE